MSGEENRAETVAFLTPLLILEVSFINRERNFQCRLAKISFGIQLWGLRASPIAGRFVCFGINQPFFKKNARVEPVGCMGGN